MSKILPVDIADNDDIVSIASSSIHSETQKDDDNEENIEMKRIKQKSKFIQARNKLRDDVLNDVMATIMPDIGAYDIDGMAAKNITESGQCVKILKFLGILNLDLHDAVLSGSAKHVKYSIKKFTNVKNKKYYDPSLINQYDLQGRTPLSLAVKIKKFEIVEILLDHDALPDIIDETTGRTPLMFSIIQNTMKITNLLIGYKASVHMPDFHFITPLMLAASTKDLDHMKLLCKNLVEVDAQDDNVSYLLYYIYIYTFIFIYIFKI